MEIFRVNSDLEETEGRQRRGMEATDSLMARRGRGGTKVFSALHVFFPQIFWYSDHGFGLLRVFLFFSTADPLVVIRYSKHFRYRLHTADLQLQHRLFCPQKFLSEILLPQLEND